MEAPDTVIGGKYRLVRKLGQGGMGSVWLAEHLTLNSQVAIKLIDASIVTNPEALSRFMREARAAAALRSPHVVQVLDHGVDNGTPFIAMELLEGESLADRLERQGRLAPLEAARIMTQVARAMSRAHEAGIVHRDLKPDNIFLVRNDDEEIAKVLDFGVAKTAAPGAADAAVSGATRTGSVLGTPYYMSPEQAEGAKSLDHRTDIWAMGVIAFECLLGVKPFEGETLGGLLIAICSRPMPVPSRFGEVPSAFDEWFERACNRDVSLRYPTAKEAAASLKWVCGGEPTEMRGPVLETGAHAAVAARSAIASHPGGQTSAGFSSSQLGVDSRRARSSRGLALGLGVAAVLLVGVGAFAWSRAGTSHAGTPASEPSSASNAQAPSAAAQNVAVSPAPLPAATTAMPSAVATPAAPAESAATNAATPVAAHVAPAPGKHHAAAAHAEAHAQGAPATPVIAPAPAPAAPAKTNAPAKVNLGI